MNTDEKHYELELIKARIQKKQYILENKKFWLSVLAIFVAVLGYVFTVSKYFDEKATQRRIKYKASVSDLYSLNPNTVKLAIRDISKFEDFYAESIPILADFIFTCNDSAFRVIEGNFVFIIRGFGEEFVEYVIEYARRNQKENNSFRNNRFQKLLHEIFMSSKTFQKPLVIKDIVIQNSDLLNKTISYISFKQVRFKNSTFTGTVFQNCKFSRVVFDSCSLWQNTFDKDCSLENVTFKACNLQDAILYPDCNTCSFIESNVLNMQIAIQAEQIGEIFDKCTNVETVIIINQ